MNRMAQFVATFRAQLAADRKKAAVLGIVLVVFIIAVGRLFLKSQPSPVDAEETTAAVPTSPSAQEPGRPFESLIVEATPPPARPNSWTDALKIFQRAPGAKEVAQVDGMPLSLQRDLFSTRSWSAFPVAVLENDDHDPGFTAPAGDGFWSRLAGQLATQRANRQSEIDKIDSELRDLSLTGTMVGEPSVASISGRVLRVGDKIRGFSVMRISERSVELQKRGYSRTLTLQ
jgi:hypothetical protein